MKTLSRFDRVHLARHQERPFTLDYIRYLCTDWIELHGDRKYREDPAVVGGWATLGGRTVMVIGQQKGRDMKENLRRNFGSPHPEGYRKAERLFRLAEKFGRPVVTFVDTQGAYPGIGAEERGQAEAIARNLIVMAGLRVPIVTCIIGEGGSGGALGIAVGDRVLMMENAIYSVISPEGLCGDPVAQSRPCIGCRRGVEADRCRPRRLRDHRRGHSRTARRRAPRPGDRGSGRRRGPRSDTWTSSTAGSRSPRPGTAREVLRDGASGK